MFNILESVKGDFKQIDSDLDRHLDLITGPAKQVLSIRQGALFPNDHSELGVHTEIFS